MATFATPTVPPPTVTIRWDDDKTRHLLRLIFYDPLCTYHKLFAHVGSNKRLNEEAKLEHASALLELCLRLFKTHCPFWKADMERRGLIETDQHGICKPSATWIVTRHTYNTPLYYHLKNLKAAQAKYAKEIKEAWTTWEEVKAADPEKHNRIRAKHPFYFSIRRFLQKINSLDQSRSGTPSSRTTGSITPALFDAEPSLESTSRPKKRASDVIAPTPDEKSEPPTPVKKPRQLPNFTKVIRPRPSPEASERDCKPLVLSTTTSPLTPLPPLPDEPIGNGAYFPTPTLSVDEIGYGSLHSAATTPPTSIATPTATEQNVALANPRYSPSRDPRVARRSVNCRNTLDVTLGSPDATPSPSPAVQAYHMSDQAGGFTPIESALTTPISAHENYPTTGLDPPRPAQEITINIEPGQFVPFVPKYEPSRDPRLQQRPKSVLAHKAVAEQPAKQEENNVRDRGMVRVEESPVSACATTMEPTPTPKQVVTTSTSSMPERSGILVSGTAFKVRPIDWDADPVYTKTLLSNLYADPRIRSALLPDLHTLSSGEQREPWKVERDAYIRIMEKEPGQVWLKEAKGWKWVGIKEKAGVGVWWKASMLWPETEELGLKARLADLRDKWLRGTSDLGVDTLKTDGASWPTMLELIFGPPGIKTSPPQDIAARPLDTPSVSACRTPQSRPGPLHQDMAEDFLKKLEEDFGVTTPNTWARRGPYAWPSPKCPETRLSSPAMSYTTEEGEMSDRQRYNRGNTRLPAKPNAKGDAPREPRSMRTDLVDTAVDCSVLATRAKMPPDFTPKIHGVVPWNARDKIRLANSPAYGVKDLPSRRYQEYVDSQSKAERDEVLELGRAELYIEGIMEHVTRWCVRPGSIKYTFDKCAFDVSTIPSRHVLERLDALIRKTGGVLAQFVDKSSDNYYAGPDRKFEIRLFGGGPGSRDRCFFRGDNSVFKVGLMEYLRHVERCCM